MYLVGKQETEFPLSSDEMDTKMWAFLNGSIGEPQEATMVRKRRYPDHIPALKPTSKERMPDTETVQIHDVHVPYAAGFLVVKPGDDVGAKPDYSFETYFSEDHIDFLPEFEDIGE